MSALAHSADEGAAGRVCPLDYTYRLRLLRARRISPADVALRGRRALWQSRRADRDHGMAAARANAELVFNGDFHWVDAEPAWFAEIERGVAPLSRACAAMSRPRFRASRISAPAAAATIPRTVSEDVVHRSNEILRQLRAEMPDMARARLRALPMQLVAQVGSLRIGIVHGDAASLAGWRFAQAALDDPKQQAWRDDIASASRIDVFASTHTGEAALRDFTLPPRRLTVVNNGAAGMPNFAGTRFGVVTRIATTLPPHRPLYGLARSGVRVDALPVVYDHDAFSARFLQRWPQGSTAYEVLLAAHRQRAGLRAGPGKTAMRLSIIIPVLNEAAGIEAALRALALFRTRGIEVIVVDGGSSDGTLSLARPLADRVLSAPRGRAAQMNAGATATTGDALLFLHADTRLPDDADRLAVDGLKMRAWGRFDVRFDSGGWLRLVALTMNLRSRLTGIATGDQAMFMTRAAFEAAGGFPPIALMEDVALSARLKRFGRPLCLSARVTSSGRRWRRHGLWRTILLMWRLRLRYFLGADPARLARAYGYDH